jgi:hypothetical protein
MQASVEPDLKAARDAHIETSVLGIELGQPVNFPPCPEAHGDGLNAFIGGLLVDTSPLPGPCRVVSGGPMGLGSLFNKVAVTGEFLPLPGTEDLAVRLPASQCPDWVSYSIVVTVKDDYAIMVSLLTKGRDSFADIERKLTAKYHKSPDRGPDSRCQVTVGGTAFGGGARITTDTAPVKYWDLPGLGAIYVPYGSALSCDQGSIMVQLDAYSRLRKDVKDAHDAAQPKF